MLDNLVVERFREGHNNIELKKHLCLYPSTGLQDLIGACVRFETHVELGARSCKPNEGVHTVRGNDSTELSFEEVARAARKLGFQLRPWVDRQETNNKVGDRITEIMDDLTGTRTVEVPNKGGNTPRTETRVRAH